MPSSRTLVRRSLALVCLALVALVGPNVVLCQGESGHVAAESMFDSAECCAAATAPHAAGPELRAADGCGSCRDVRLLVADAQGGLHAFERLATSVASPHAELPLLADASGRAVPLAAPLRPGHVVSTVLRS